MTVRRPDLDLVLDAFLADGPTAAPDRALDGALGRVAVLGQRPRPLTMTLSGRPLGLRLAFAAALLALALVLAGIAVVGNRPTLPPSSPSPGPSGLASTPRASPLASSVAGADPYTLVIRAALNQVDHATGAAQSAQAISGDESYAVIQFVDGMTAYLDVADSANVQRLLGELENKVARMRAELDAGGTAGAALRRTVTTLGNTIRARPLASGVLAAGPYHSSTFSQTVVVTLPAGWTRRAEDSEVVALQKGSVSLAFSHSTATVSPDFPHAGACWHLAPESSCPPPEIAGPAVATAPGGYSGWLTRATATVPMAIWSSAALQSQFTYVTAAGDEILTWVVDVRGQPLTIDLTGPPADVAAVLPEVETMLEDVLVA